MNEKPRRYASGLVRLLPQDVPTILTTETTVPREVYDRMKARYGKML